VPIRIRGRSNREALILRVEFMPYRSNRTDTKVLLRSAVANA